MSFTLNSWQKDLTAMRSYTPSTDTQYKSFNRPNTQEDSNNKFNLQKFRSSIHDKIQPLVRGGNDYERRRLNDSQISEGRSSVQGVKKNRDALASFMGGADLDRRQQYKQKNESIPTFDTLERNIQGLSSSRARDETFFQSSKLRNPLMQQFQPKQSNQSTAAYSPQKLTGIKSKIGGIGGVKSTSNLFQEQRKSDFTMYPSSQSKMTTPSARNEFKSLVQNTYSGFLTDKDNKILFPTASNFNVKQKNLSDVVPINNIIEMRNKIESNAAQGQLSSNYLNELVKLASIITSTVKKIR